jgi:hypothetical protein
MNPVGRALSSTPPGDRDKGSISPQNDQSVLRGHPLPVPVTNTNQQLQASPRAGGSSSVDLPPSATSTVTALAKGTHIQVSWLLYHACGGRYWSVSPVYIAQWREVVEWLSYIMPYGGRYWSASLIYIARWRVVVSLYPAQWREVLECFSRIYCPVEGSRVTLSYDLWRVVLEGFSRIYCPVEGNRVTLAYIMPYGGKYWSASLVCIAQWRVVEWLSLISCPMEGGIGGLLSYILPGGGW